MNNIGEEIVGEYLKVILGCDFVEYNLYTPDVQGEIDVVGINAEKKEVYICEVATHLITGLQYVISAQPDNVNRFVKKFRKNVAYANKYFAEYKKSFMLWSPIVKNQGAGAQHNQLRDISKIKEAIRKEFGYEIESVINHDYQKRISQLRAYAAKETKELKSPVLRMMQIEEKLKKHLARGAHNNSLQRDGPDGPRPELKRWR